MSIIQYIENLPKRRRAKVKSESSLRFKQIWRPVDLKNPFNRVLRALANMPLFQSMPELCVTLIDKADNVNTSTIEKYFHC